MQLHWIDLAVLAGYMLAMLWMGWYFSRRNTSTEEYFVGSRRFSGWVIGLSLVGTSISSVTFLAYPADAYKTAWLRYLPNLMLPIGILIAAYVFLPFFRRKNVTTAYQYLEDRFGPSVRVYGAAAFVLAQLVRISTILYLLSLLVHEMTGLDTITCIVVSGVFVAAYTILGGINAVIWTDVIQTIVLTLGGLICLAIIVHALPGGMGQIFEVAGEFNKLSFSELRADGQLHPVTWELSFAEKTATMMLILGLTSWLTEYASNQNTVQRYVAARSTEEARRGMFVCAAASLPIWAFYMFLGTALFVYFQAFPAVEATEMLDGTRKAEQILPFFIMNELPVGLVGLVIAAALAAAMSSLDSSINAISTVSVIDAYKRHIAKGRDDRHYLLVAKLVGCAAAAFMILGAIYIYESETKTLQDTATILVSLLGGGLLGLFMLGFFTRQADARAAWVGIGCTMLFTLWTILDKKGLLPAALQMPFDAYYTAIIGNLLMFFVGYAAGRWLLPARKDLTNLTVWERA
ncbi:sodium:solute symporter [Biformimicrobium ophioploci]|uniref:Sodium:solute symporter n=1 Tax=Biformimicrobium ophioploci TaxID=3036711 RepID=A0ABQ6M113_9GAMM|nr:sodium:solute symporter [Microbulbifer sp. NKW57]GMG87987.1 sodium:solute symporter [Microbulbifer sp. NKW57]